eukprot:m.337984 g.337984  ORF g.337984 m.337984 type:complete len:121 (-) comp18284_c0_seq1:137-499(-)
MDRIARASASLVRCYNTTTATRAAVVGATSANIPPKLFAVTLVRSPIGANPKIRATLKSLGLTKMHKTVVTKNIESSNGKLLRCIGHVEVRPVELDAEGNPVHVPRLCLPEDFVVEHATQ